jgi:ABC-type multidrug transport system fused ATPase/permease subunit
VIDYDKLIVMGGGQLLEQGTPKALLETHDSTLSSMAKALGDTGEAALRDKCDAAP